jgi:rhodanese-related sulfurtransferase
MATVEVTEKTFDSTVTQGRCREAALHAPEPQTKNAPAAARANVIEKMLPTVLVVAALLVVGYFVFMKGGDVSSAEARQLVASGARLVDVRTPGEFAAGHIPGAINIPVQQLESRLGELEPKDTAIVVYCRSGSRSGNAAGMLKNAGFAVVRDLGPMSRW